jgi:hypothetical protein
VQKRESSQSKAGLTAPNLVSRDEGRVSKKISEQARQPRRTVCLLTEAEAKGERELTTEDTKEHKGKTKFSHELTGMSAICFCGFAAPKICAGREGFLVW